MHFVGHNFPFVLGSEQEISLFLELPVEVEHNQMVEASSMDYRCNNPKIVYSTI